MSRSREATMVFSFHSLAAATMLARRATAVVGVAGFQCSTTPLGASGIGALRPNCSLLLALPCRHRRLDAPTVRLALGAQLNLSEARTTHGTPPCHPALERFSGHALSYLDIACGPHRQQSHVARPAAAEGSAGVWCPGRS